MVHRGRRPWIPRARPEALPDLRPSAGHYLIAGIDAVLPLLTATPDALALAEDLRVSLARTAACGDTCRVRDAADAVRLAACMLVSGDIDDARAELLRARTDLGARP
ncbi:MAG TPA: hypothetical protein VGX25_05650 [Actinophytocola sp.]|uniref:hypothetical protein n=1 Tax=Actinophytocola sp. TaxID=1872138 RepID=UPI002DDCD482|nr:hypothetical protein [Actinophytocola sp.]HEV2778868.1 hypothetical protein [Actinophytocola sp.]